MGSGGFRNEGRGRRNQRAWGTEVSLAGFRGRAPVGVWGLSPQNLRTYYENNCQKHRLLVGQSKNNELRGLVGGPLLVGGLGPGAPGPSPKSGPVMTPHECMSSTLLIVGAVDT